MEKVSGVNKNLYSEYDFEDHIWHQNQSEHEDLLHFAHRATKIGKNYFVKKVGGSHWMEFGNIKDAEKEAYNTWMGGMLPSTRVVSAELIDTFFSGDMWVQTGKPPKTKYERVKVGSCPNIDSKMVIPFGPQFVSYKNKNYLNSWYDDMIYGNDAHIGLGKKVLVMIYGGLCNGVINDYTNLKADADRIYNMVLTGEYDNAEFKFAMCWLASLVQKPGINLQTNMWFIGEQQGVGKGTIIAIMAMILGQEFVGMLNQTEIEAGWNDHLIGKQLVEINEFDTSSKMSGKAWGKWIKNHTVEVALKIRQRNITAYDVLNIGNYIGASNNIEQTFVDAEDRRNQFIQTSSNPFWVKYAANIQINSFKKRPIDVAAGFAYILEQVKVDEELIAKSFNNAIRQGIVSNSTTVIEDWLNNDATVTRDKWVTSTDMFEDFKKWYVHNVSANFFSITAFGRLMKNSSKVGVKWKRTNANVQYYIGQPPVAKVVDLEEVSNVCNTISDEGDVLVVYDNVEEDKMFDISAITPLERMRQQLRKDFSRVGDEAEFE